MKIKITPYHIGKSTWNTMKYFFSLKHIWSLKAFKKAHPLEIFRNSKGSFLITQYYGHKNVRAFGAMVDNKGVGGHPPKGPAAAISPIFWE